MMQLRPTTIITSLALLSSAVYSSRPLAFTAPTATTNYNSRSTYINNNNNIFSKRVKRRVLAHTFLHHATSVDQEQTTSEFLSKKRSRQQRSSSMTDDEDNKDDSIIDATDNNNSNGISSTTLSMIVDSQKEFELNLGRAIDTLKSDYPTLLTKNPSWNIYHSDLEVIDPTGVSLHGLENYKMAFSFIHGVVKWFYCEEKSSLTSVRVAYDWARKCIRVSWNVELVPKMIYGGIKRTLHVDGISEYYLDRESGLITEHKVSKNLTSLLKISTQTNLS